MELSNRYFKGFLEKQGKSYIEYIMDILDENQHTEGVSHQDIVFEPVSGPPDDLRDSRVKDRFNKRAGGSYGVRLT